MRLHGRITAVALPCAAMVLLSASWAAELDFRPAAEFQLYDDGNPQVVGPNATSDTVSRLKLDLVLLSLGRRTNWRVSYRPYHETYSDASLLDNTGHILSGNLKHDASQRSSLTVDLYAARTEDQEIREEIIGEPDSLIPRTTIERLRLSTQGSVDATTKSTVTWRAAGGLYRFEDLPQIQFEDSDDFEIGAGWARRITRQANLGVALSHRRIGFETQDDVETQILSLTSVVRFSPNFRLDARVGAERAESRGLSDTRPSVDLRFVRTVDRGQDVTFGVRQLVSPGTGAGGASEDRGGFVSWRYHGSRRFGARASLRYWHRERLETTPGARSGNEGVKTAEAIDWYVGRFLSLGLFHGYTQQDPLGGADPNFTDADYHTAGGFLRWDIRGRERRRP